MTQVAQFRIALQGWVGGPGQNTIHALSFEEGAPSQAALTEFGGILNTVYNNMKSIFVGQCSFSILPEVKILNVSDASLIAVRQIPTWSLSTPVTTTKTSRATMAKLQFITDRVRGNRMLRGGVYFGPIDDDAIAGDGSLTSGAKTTLSTAWAGAIDVNVTDQMRLCVYGRPNPEASNPNAREGVTGYVQAVNVMSVPAVLRSRRD